MTNPTQIKTELMHTNIRHLDNPNKDRISTVITNVAEITQTKIETFMESDIIMSTFLIKLRMEMGVKLTL